MAQPFVSAILDYIDDILVFPLAGRARDDVRAGMRTATFKKRTLSAYEVDESSVRPSCGPQIVRTKSGGDRSSPSTPNGPENAFRQVRPCFLHQSALTNDGRNRA